MTAEQFTEALAGLLAACGASPGALRCVTVGDLEIAVTQGIDGITVDLSGWRHRFTLSSDDEDDDDNDDNDDNEDNEDNEDDDAALLALDLIGAAMFGVVRIMAESYGGQPRRFTLQIQRGGSWQIVTRQGSRPWNIFAARRSRIHRGDAQRPAQYAATPVTSLPWAPWAGECGFFGAASGAGASELPVDGELDLHNFRPREIKPLLLAYIDACLARGIHELRIVHGKGVGNLRRTVHAILGRHPRVRGYRLGGHGGGGWGATIVDLSPEPGPPEER